MEELLKKISEKIKKTPSELVAYEDLYYIVFDVFEKNKELALFYGRYLSGAIEEQIQLTENESDIRLLFGLHKKVLLMLAPYDFESYLLYVEWERAPDKKFYQPRRKALRPVVVELQNLADDKLDLLDISLPPGIGKLISDDTPVFTKDGWKTHGELTVGDFVVGLDGKYKEVEYIFPKNYADYLVEFTNGEQIKCHGNHEWFVYNRHRMKYENLTTEEMQTQDIEILAEILKVKHYTLQNIYEQVGCKRYEIRGLREDLRKLGMCQRRNAIKKFIPEIRNNDFYIP